MPAFSKLLKDTGLECRAVYYSGGDLADPDKAEAAVSAMIEFGKRARDSLGTRFLVLHPAPPNKNTSADYQRMASNLALVNQGLVDVVVRADYHNHINTNLESMGSNPCGGDLDEWLQASKPFEQLVGLFIDTGHFVGGVEKNAPGKGNDRLNQIVEWLVRSGRMRYGHLKGWSSESYQDWARKGGKRAMGMVELDGHANEVDFGRYVRTLRGSVPPGKELSLTAELDTVEISPEDTEKRNITFMKNLGLITKSLD